MKASLIPSNILDSFMRGMVIPAMPLALTENRRFDEKYQTALVRYYIDAGAGGIAAGVHSTQFEIRDPEFDLYEPVLALVSRTIDTYAAGPNGGLLKVAGVSGNTAQAAGEAELARDHGYHVGLVSLGALADATLEGLLSHCSAIAAVIPVCGFYLQPAVGGRVLPYEFWRQFARIENVIAIKIAPFDRYQTLDVVRGVSDSGREGEIALYTGNDDNIVVDLLTKFRMRNENGVRTLRIRGGLLGHWGFWTKSAVDLLVRIHALTDDGDPIPAELLTVAADITDVNAAVFDPANGFKGCISGIHEILHRQGLLRGIWCLNPDEKLSPGQSEEITRVNTAYPYLSDDDFVRENLDRWLA